MVISSLDGTEIKKVDMRFSYYDDEHVGTVSAAPGSLSAITVVDDDTCDAVATVESVNATAVRISSSFQSDSQMGPNIDQVTIYYEGMAENTLTASAVEATQTLTYNTAAQSLAMASVFNVSDAQGAVTFSKKSGDDGITVSSDGNVTVKEGLAVGTYDVVFAVKAAGDATYDEATQDVAVTFVINKAANTLQASAVEAKQALTYKTAVQNLSKASVFKVSGAQGAVTFSKKSGDAGITVSSDGKVTVKKGLAAGSYKVVFTVKAAGDANYDEATKNVAVTFAIKKASNTLSVKAVKRTAKASKVAKQAVTVARPIKIAKHQGELKYTKVKADSSKYLIVDKASGKVTVKKGTPKGTYTIKIKVTAAGNNNYKPRTKTVTCKIKVA